MVATTSNSRWKSNNFA